MHCTGCWAAEYGNQLNLSLETMDSIICQGKKLGTYMYIYTGGEPLVRKADLMKICQMHPDCEFLSFTNGTLIDEDFCQEMLKVKNFVPAISLEGFEEANDSRRGAGAYQKVEKAMELLKKHHLIAIERLWEVPRMKSYPSLIPISAKVRKRQNRRTLLCIIISVLL